MSLFRRAILALALIAGITPAFAQAPGPVPALPDAERRTAYSISGSTCACAVGFALYGDSTDYANWLTVWVNGVQMAQAGNWTITSPSGSLATLPRPITDAVLTFTAAQTGTVQIVGARRPRRTSQFQENTGVPARNLNQVLSDLEAQVRELWDRQVRTVQGAPGEAIAILPAAASRASLGACFNSGGDLTSCLSIPSGTFAAGNGILFTGTNPTGISANLLAGTGITITGTSPLVISNNVQAGTGINITGTNPVVISTSGTAPAAATAPQGRLTLAASTPVMAASQTAATILYYAPYNGGIYLPLFTAGIGLRPLSFTSSDTDTVGLQINLGSSWAANSNYDAYAFVNGSAAGFCTSPDWSSGAGPGSNAVGSSIRGTGAGSAEQQLFKGILTNKNVMTCRTGNASTISCAVNECTFLGSFRTGAAGQISFTYGSQGVAGTFNLWNAYNQTQFCSTSSDPNLTVTGTSSATPQQFNNSAINQFNFMAGLATGIIDASANNLIRTAAVAAFGGIGLALDSTATVAKAWRANNQNAQNLDVNTGGSVTFQAVMGPHFVSLNQFGDGTNAGTYFGQNFQALRVCLWQ